MRIEVAAVTLALLGLTQAAPTPPVYDGQYTITGYLLLPYAELKEPFTAYYDPKQAKSRIDYYNGVMLTYQIAKSDQNNFSTQYKVVWSPDKDTHKPVRVCYQANGTDEGGAIDTQNVLPKTDGMKFVREEACDTGSFAIHVNQQGRLCERYESVVFNEDKKNTYTLWVRRSGDFAFPIRYVMKGYNSLLGSHYDKYEVVYTSYSSSDIEAKIFDPYSEYNGACVPFPDGAGTNVKHHHHLTNPMQEFINNDDRHVHEQFELFKSTHGRNYQSEHEHETRKNHFRHNLRYINSINRSNRTYTVAMNHLGDKSDEEIKFLHGLRHTLGTSNDAKAFPSADFKDAPLPESMDWRLLGAVTPVKDQAVCGSCWSFGTTGTIEGQVFLRTNHGLVSLSEQQLIDCSWNDGNGGCDGGEDWRAYDYIKKYGLAATDDYGSYMGIDGKCHDGEVPKILETIKGYVNVTNADDLKKAIANVGPISVGIDASHKSLSFYSNGIYYEPECRNDVQGLDHAVLAVGYGTLNGEAYWLIKNSWSTYWGNDGYVLMSQRDNNCGVATAASYIEI